MGSACNYISEETNISTVQGTWAAPRLKHSLTSNRKGKDYTYLYGKHIGTGSLTPYIDAAFDERVDEYVRLVMPDFPILQCAPE